MKKLALLTIVLISFVFTTSSCTVDEMEQTEQQQPKSEVYEDYMMQRDSISREESEIDPPKVLVPPIKN